MPAATTSAIIAPPEPPTGNDAETGGQTRKAHGGAKVVHCLSERDGRPRASIPVGPEMVLLRDRFKTVRRDATPHPAISQRGQRHSAGAGTPVPIFPSRRSGEMERGGARVCETLMVSLRSGNPARPRTCGLCEARRPGVRLGLRSPARRARPPMAVCEAPAGTLRLRRSTADLVVGDPLPAACGRVMTATLKPTDAKSVSHVFRAGITFFGLSRPITRARMRSSAADVMLDQPEKTAELLESGRSARTITMVPTLTRL